MIRSGVAQVTLSSTPIHNLFIPNIDQVSVIEFNVTTAVNLTGVAGFLPSQIMIFKNTGSGSMAMPANNVNSDPENRFSALFTLNAGVSFEMRYDPNTLLIDRLL